VNYDEFSMFRENAEEAGIPWRGAPTVERVQVDLPDARKLSGLAWGQAEPEIVLVHGGAQNAHTWDSVALALDRPLLALDLPGHGLSDWREDGRYDPVDNAQALARAVEHLAPNAQLVVGMSLGGLSCMVLASTRPELVQRLLLVDVTPGVTAGKAEAVIQFVTGPETFASFDEILARTVKHNPTRSEASLRRGILHNARELRDGSWTWRYDRRRFTQRDEAREGTGAFFGDLWDHISKIRAPLMLCRGARSPVVDDADVAEFLRRQPQARVEVVEDAGHSIQGDQPVELARRIEAFSTA